MKGLVYRALNTQRPLRVEAGPDRRPAAVYLGTPPRRVAVAAIQDRWLVEDGWWREPVRRMYFQLALADGRPLTAYLDMIEGTWYQQPYHGPAEPPPLPPEPEIDRAYPGRSA
jgi:hypothetical protein